MKLSKLSHIILTILASCLLLVGFGVLFSQAQLKQDQEQINQTWTEVDALYQNKLQTLQELTTILEEKIGASEREVFSNVINSIQDYGSSNQTKDRVEAAGYVEAAQARLEKTIEDYSHFKTSQITTLFEQIESQQQQFEPHRNQYNQLIDTYNQKLTRFPYRSIASAFEIPPENTFDLTAETPELSNVTLPIPTPGLASAAPIQLKLPPLNGFVNDIADILPPTFEQSLEKQLVATATQGKKTQVVVVTIPSLQDMPIELVSEYMIETWNIGQGYNDRGVLFLISVNDQVIRITPTQSLVEEITPERATTIINRQVAPAFEAQKHLNGVQTGTNTILLLAEDDSTLKLPITSRQTTSFDQVLMPFLALVMVYFITLAGAVILIILSYKKINWWVSVILAASIGALLGQFHQVGLLTGLLFGLIPSLYALTKRLKY